jgi:hypothetical protein
LAGHEQNGKMAIEDCQDAIRDLPVTHRSLKGIKRVLRKAVKPICDEYVLSRPASEQRDVAFELMVGCWLTLGGGHRLLVIGTNGAVNVLEHGYGCLGIGNYLGDYIARHGFVGPDMSMHDIMLLSTQTLNAVKSYDQFCGGPSQFVVIGKDGRHRFEGENQWLSFLINNYEGSARQLLFAIAGAEPSDFEHRLNNFVANVRMLRTESDRQATRVGRLGPQSTTADSSHPQPSQESPGGSDES